MGRLITADGYNEEVTFCDHFIRLRIVEPVLAKYLDLYSDTDGVRGYIEVNMVSSAGQNTVSQTTMLNIPVPLPPRAEMARMLEEIERLFSVIAATEKITEATLARADRQRQAILQKAFRGELV